MWAVNGTELKMCEGDWGLSLPITVTGPTFSASDEVKLTIKTAVNGDTLITKTFSNIDHNTVSFVLTEEESALLPVGSYVYSLDWFQNNAFLCNIIPVSALKVVEKA